MKDLKKIILTLSLVMISVLFFAQNKCTLELRPGVNNSTQDLEDVNLKTGYGFEATFSYNFMEHIGAYVGWGWNQFKSDGQSFAGNDADFEETGYTFGLQFIHLISEGSKLSYLLRAGGIYNHIESENKEGDITADSGHGLGWEFGAGLNFDLGNKWGLRPQIGYRALSRDIEIEPITTNVELNYISFSIGIAKSF